MNSDSPIPVAVSAIPQPASEVATPQVRFKSEAGRLLLMLPTETEVATSVLNWTELTQQLKHRLNSGDRFWQAQTPVHLIARDRLLDVRQIQAIAETLTEFELPIKRVHTSRRQTAVAAVTLGYSVEQHAPVTHLNGVSEVGQALADPLYLQTTLRSGMEIRHPGSVVIMGDVNAGSSVIADGDVLVWGVLRGVVQAGASGNTQCLIMALRMEPTQLRIATLLARAPEMPPAEYFPEIAYVSPEGIRIARACDFSKSRLTKPLT